MAIRGQLIEDTYSEEDLLTALELSEGSVKRLGESIGCGRRAVYDWLDRCPDKLVIFNRIKKSRLSITLDLASDKLVDRIESEDEGISLGAIKFALRYGKGSDYNPDSYKWEGRDSPGLDSYLDSWRSGGKSEA